MSLDDLRLALGVSEALINEALWVLTFPGDKRIKYPTPGRVALGPDLAGTVRQSEDLIRLEGFNADHAEEQPAAQGFSAMLCTE